MSQEYSAERVSKKSEVNPSIQSSIYQDLSSSGQESLIRHLSSLGELARTKLENEVSKIEWASLNDRAVKPDLSLIRDSNVLSVETRKLQATELRELGLKAFEDGSVAFLLMAGGQGTRLGVSIPKGCFSIGAISGKTLYEIHAEKVLAISSRYGREFPLLVMTSPATDSDTRAFFQENGNFGLSDSQLRFFCQGMVPSLSLKGDAILKDDSLVLNPDGHGGCLTAIHNSGNLARLHSEGFKHLLYMQIDNPLILIDDPEFLGLAIREGSDMLSKVVKKANSEEMVGHLVSLDGVDRMVEYMELSPEQRVETNQDGELRFRWGNVAAHYFSIDWLLDICDSGIKLPFHESEKKLKTVVDGVESEVKIVKLERFIFDLLPLTSRHMGVEILRAEEFAPVKNSEGVDSPETARQIASDLYTSWLREAGVEVKLNPGEFIEISPYFAQSRSEFMEKWDRRAQQISGSLYIS